MGDLSALFERENESAGEVHNRLVDLALLLIQQHQDYLEDPQRELHRQLILFDVDLGQSL